MSALFGRSLPGTRGAPALGGSLDFAHPAHPIATPLVFVMLLPVSERQ